MYLISFSRSAVTESLKTILFYCSYMFDLLVPAEFWLFCG